MKKILFFGIVLVLGFYFFELSENVLIPDDAIRFRVIASSNLESDQEVKRLVSERLQSELYDELKNVKTLEEARFLLGNSTSEVTESVKKVLLENNLDSSFDVNYGMNYFPEKIYNGVTYKSGNYESLVVTLGSGVGDNWWCVLFPPLCLMEAEEKEDSSNIEYKFFVKELIDKYF